MAGLVLYIGLVVLCSYLLFAVLPQGRSVWISLGLALAVAVGGWAFFGQIAEDGEVDRISQASFVLFGIGVTLAGCVQAIRLVLTSRRFFGAYGLLVLVAPFVAASAAFILFGPSN